MYIYIFQSKKENDSFFHLFPRLKFSQRCPSSFLYMLLSRIGSASPCLNWSLPRETEWHSRSTLIVGGIDSYLTHQPRCSKVDKCDHGLGRDFLNMITTGTQGTIQRLVDVSLSKLKSLKWPITNKKKKQMKTREEYLQFIWQMKC